jgi:triacylglycerol lipase
MAIRPRLTPDIELVFHPQRDASYVHFLDAGSHPFDATATRMSRCNAWWLAEAALLSYWPPDEVRARYARIGFESVPVFGGTTQCYVAWNDRVVFVTFRGTEPGEPGDLLDDLTFALAPWDKDKHLQAVHLGFKLALERVWDAVSRRLAALAGSRSVWFSGHSLGAALAALGADRHPTTAGVLTLGAPRVGDWHFAAAHTTRFGARALRYVNDADVVTHLPLPLPYQHAGTPRFIDPGGHVTSVRPTLHHYFADLVGDPEHVREVRLALDRGQLRHAPDFLLDHMPRGYCVDMWNDYVRFGD